MKIEKLIAGLLAVFSMLNINAQEIRMNSIPFAMHFENEVKEYKILGDDHLSITAPGKTELFISPDGGFVANQTPRLIFQPDSDFILTSTIKLDFKANWDAGALLVYNDDRHYAKFCFEQDYTGQPRIVTVVCNETCDDCNSAIVEKNEVNYKIVGSSKNNVFAFYYSEDGKSWFLLRAFKLDKTDNIRIGFSAQSPAGDGCIVDFSNIQFQAKKPKDWWHVE